MKKLVLLTYIILGAINARAMIGDTKQQSANRYGKPIQEKGNISCYKQKGFIISEWYDAQGVVEVICYYKLSGTITDRESKRICTANLPSGIQMDDWIEQNDQDPNCRLWMTANSRWCYESGVARLGKSKNFYSCVLVGTVSGVAQLNEQSNGVHGDASDVDAQGDI